MGSAYSKPSTRNWSHYRTPLRIALSNWPLSCARTYIHTYVHQLDMSPQNAFLVFSLLEKYLASSIGGVFRVPISIFAYLSNLSLLRFRACLAWPCQLVSRRSLVVWTRATLIKRRFDHQPPIEEMSLPVARQLILIEGSQSLFEWLVSTLFGMALALALDWHRTGCGSRVPYLPLPLPDPAVTR